MGLGVSLSFFREDSEKYTDRWSGSSSLVRNDPHHPPKGPLISRLHKPLPLTGKNTTTKKTHTKKDLKPKRHTWFNSTA
jgi:hypothetical protein